MRIRFWGVRGSIPVPGPSTVKYGGNTPCIDILTADGQVIILDAGTGIRRLGKVLLEEHNRRVDARVFLSHTHWDHIQGFPFFEPLISRNNNIEVYGGRRIGKHLEEILAGQFSEPYLPFAYRSLQATMSVHEVDPSETLFLGEQTTVSVANLNHPGGALGFRIEDAGLVFTYCCDTSHEGKTYDEGLLALARNADLLVHDAHFASHESATEFADWGHSSYVEAGDFARAAGVKTLGLFHYSPDISDDELDRVGADARAHFPRTILTREGMVLNLPLSEDSLD